MTIKDNKKLTKVVMYFDNGDSQYLEGKNAQIWADALNSAVSNDFIHGGRTQKMLKTVEWKKEERNV